MDILLLFFIASIEDHSFDKYFEEIYEKYKNKVYSIAYGITQNEDDASEAFQDAFNSIAMCIHRIDFDDEIKLKVYIYKTTKNASYDVIRKKKRIPKMFNIDDFSNTLVAEDAYKSIENKEIAAIIKNYISTMPETYRDVLSYKLIHKLSIEEISILLHRPIETVKSQYKRGIKIVSKALKEFNI